MRSAVSTVLVIATSLLAVGFLGAGSGGWLIATDSGEGGANIGAGILMLFGTAAGAVGLLLATAALVLAIIRGQRSRVRGRR